jgi:hypothetical protein
MHFTALGAERLLDMKEILSIGAGIFLLAMCCTLMVTGASTIFLGLLGSTWASMAGIGALASFGYFFFGK